MALHKALVDQAVVLEDPEVVIHIRTRNERACCPAVE
jgi:hypothetical protein